MKVRRFFCVLISVLILLSTLSGALLASAEKYKMPYYITIDLTNQIVTVYRTSDDAIVRQMLCSSGLNYSTPTGTYYLPRKEQASERTEWYYFRLFGCYAHYATRIYKGVLFHSIPYSRRSEKTISRTALSEYGRPASHGCIRLLPDDAKFIALNCLEGTRVKIYYKKSADTDTRKLLFAGSYTGENGQTYQEFFGISTDPNVLGYKSKGTAVKNLQLRLRALGYFSDEVNGKYQTTTVNAVREVQRALDVEATGMVTREFMDMILAPDTPTAHNVVITEGTSGPIVKNLQLALQTLKIYDGPIDSIYDVDVIESVKTFQQIYGYKSSVEVSTTVQKALQHEVEKIAELFGEEEYKVERTDEEMMTAVVSAKARIRMRSKATVNSGSVESLSNGNTVIVYEKGGTWSKVSHGPAKGYIMNQYLTGANTNNTALTYSSTTSSAIYKLGHTITEYQSGSTLPCEDFADFLAAQREAELNKEEETEEVFTFATVKTGDDTITLNMRSMPDTAGDVIASVPNGTMMRVLLKSSEWSYVNWDDKDGYLMNQYLEFWTGEEDALTNEEAEATPVEEEKPDPIGAIVMAESNEANVYQTNAESAALLGKLKSGIKLNIVATEDIWTIVELNGNKGYMHTAELHFVYPGEEEELETMYGIVNTEVPADVYDEDSEDANLLGHLKHGEKVTVIITDDDWSMIELNGHQGYMRNVDLQFVNE